MSIRYLKHYYVDYADMKTFLINTNIGKNGKTHPNIKGLDVKYWTTDAYGIDFCLSIINDDDVNLFLENGLLENGMEILYFEEWCNYVEIIFNNLIQNNNLQEQNFVLDKTSLESLESSFSTVWNYIESLKNAQMSQVVEEIKEE